MAILVMLFLSGCGSSPSNSDLERALTQNDPLIGKVYQIRNVRRTNGYERPNGYVVEFTAEIYVLESPTDYLASLAQGDNAGMGALAAISVATAGVVKWGLVTAASLSASKKGDVIPFTGAITMIKSQQGWIQPSECALDCRKIVGEPR